jgi:ankyrin repeat protein
MSLKPITSARPARALPAEPNLDHLKTEAKRRLKGLRERDPQAKLAAAQLAVARDYGFASWRALKAHVDTSIRQRVFAAARAGDIETVRRAFAQGFDPSTADEDGRTIHQIAKAEGHDAIELLARDVQGRDTRAPAEQRALNAILDAAKFGHVDELRRLLDAHPDLIDARGGGYEKETALHRAAPCNRHACVRLLLERGADVDIRDYPNNATVLHFAAVAGDLDMVRTLVEAGADLVGDGDDYGVGVLGWATCLSRLREDVAAYLIAHGAPLSLWSAIALDRTDAVRRFIESNRSLLDARMSRNQRYRTPLHHAAAKNRPAIVRLLLGLGADANATDATGATALTTAAMENAGPAVLAMLQEAGAKIDFTSALALRRYDLAQAMLKDDPSRIGPDGHDTITLHLAVSKKDLSAIKWLLEHGVDVNAKRMMWGCNHTALHMTMEHGALDIARMLLDAGADPNVRDDKYDATALGWAEFFGRDEFAALIRARGGSK